MRKKGKKGKTKPQVDLDYLAEAHHAAMVGGLALVQDVDLGKLINQFLLQLPILANRSLEVIL